MDDKEKQFQKFIDKTKSIRLLQDEKEELKNIIIKRMNTVPVSRQSREFINKGDLFKQSLFNRLWEGRQRRAFAYTIALLLFIVLGTTSVSAYAERALPGDPLYNLKVNFNERLPGFFLTTPIARANRESNLVEKRLEEAHELTLKGKLSAASRQIVEEQLDKHTERINKYLELFKDKKEFGHAAEIQIRLEVALRAGEKLLSKAEQLSAEVVPFTTKVRNELMSISSDHANLQKSLDEEPEINLSAISGERQKMAESAYAEIEKLVEKNKTSLHANDYKRLATRAEEGLVGAQTLMNAFLYREAIILFDEVFKLSKEAKILSETQKIEYNDTGLKEDGDREVYLNMHTLSLEDLDLFPSAIIDWPEEKFIDEAVPPTKTIEDELPEKARSSIVRPENSSKKDILAEN